MAILCTEKILEEAIFAPIIWAVHGNSIPTLCPPVEVAPYNAIPIDPQPFTGHPHPLTYLHLYFHPHSILLW